VSFVRFFFKDAPMMQNSVFNKAGVIVDHIPVLEE
jgi:hypothetical protein